MHNQSRVTHHESRFSRPRFVSALLVGAALFLGVAPGWGAGAQDRLVVGLKAFQDGFHDLASKELRAFLAAAPKDPRRPEVLYVLAQSDLARKDWAGARSDVEELVQMSGPRAREGRYWLGWLDAREGKSAPALRHMEAYLAEAGGERRVDALFLAADLARQAGLGSAATHYEAFLAVAPNDPRRPDAWLGLVQLQAKGDAAAAASTARRGLQDPVLKGDAASAEALALAGVEAARGAGDPTAEAGFWRDLGRGAREKDLRIRAQYEEGVALLRARDGQGARKALESYLAAAPKGIYAGRAHLSLADLAQTGGEGAGALAHLEKALARPEDPAVAPRRRELERAALGLALAAGDRARAATHARALLAANGPGHPEDQALAHFTLGTTAASPEEAVSQWDAVPPGTSRYREARLQAAQALMAAGRPAEALDRLLPLLGAPDPEAAVHVTALAAAEAAGDVLRAAALCAALADHPPPGQGAADFLFRRALFLQRAGDAPAYAGTLEALASRFPQDSRAGWAAAELSTLAAAREDWPGVLRWAPVARSGPDPDRAILQEAEALATTGRGGEARTALETLAARSGPHQPEALARLGALRDRAGDESGALGAYRRALEAGLEGEAAAWVRERVAALTGGAGTEKGGGTGSGETQ